MHDNITKYEHGMKKQLNIDYVNHKSHTLKFLTGTQLTTLLQTMIF
jgi:hypothetical protein